MEGYSVIKLFAICVLLVGCCEANAQPMCSCSNVVARWDGVVLDPAQAPTNGPPIAWTSISFAPPIPLDVAALRVVVRQDVSDGAGVTFTELHDEAVGAVDCTAGTSCTAMVALHVPADANGPREHCTVFVEAIR